MRRSRALLPLLLLLVLGSVSMPGSAAPSAGPADLRRLHVLIVNGGGSPQQNYQSHHLHVKALLELLRGSGLGPQQISILSSDGESPARDLAVKASKPEGFWQLDASRVGRLLEPPVLLESSSLPGHRVQPATRASVEQWFSRTGARLRGGDTLLLYVTDHGTAGKDGSRNSEITLWGPGKDASLSVEELHGLLGRLDPGVKVVSLMSQCFSGGFATLGTRPRPPGRAPFCGYFSSTADRPAYGCYPENRDKDNVGHSFHFLSALRDGHPFSAAHRDVLASDDTPDVPLTTSEVFLEDLLGKAAADAKRSLPELVDPLLRKAWRDGKRWEPEIRLLDRIAASFGMWSPRSLAELERQAGRLPEFSKKVEAHRDAWTSALGDLNVGRLQRLVEKEPQWKVALNDGHVARLPPEGRQELTTKLLSALDRLPTGRDRLMVVKQKADLTAALAYRLEVRLGVVLRLRARLLNVAGRVYLASQGTEAQRRAFAELESCERFRLPPAKPTPGTPPAAPLVAQRSPFPPFDEDVALASRVLPAWMGIRFEGTSAAAQKKYRLPAGAAFIRDVFPGSPADAAGLAPGDILLGPRGKTFTEHNEVRVWTFLSKPGEPQSLDVLRAGRRTTVAFTPGTFPGQMPELPGPPKPGMKAPPVSVAPYRGSLQPALAANRSKLLFFWATYCGPCKASLPEVLAFSRERQVPVIAISDEPKETLDEFFGSWKQPFPSLVGHDELRQAAVAYGTSGVPTFVYVDEAGVIRSHVTGYTPARGIGVPGWKHQGP